jgi:hypothetical protein
MSYLRVLLILLKECFIRLNKLLIIIFFILKLYLILKLNNYI